jgi:hypothetical protein
VSTDPGKSLRVKIPVNTQASVGADSPHLRLEVVHGGAMC